MVHCVVVGAVRDVVFYSTSTIQSRGEDPDVDPDMMKNKPFRWPTGNDEAIELANKGLEAFPENDLSKLKNTKFCYLEGNSLTGLPETFFSDLPLLEWLDLRDNNLTSIATVGLAGHQNLQVILLRNNRIKVLPYELAYVPKLRGLQLAGNPIENVPFHVISRGVTEVLKYLRKDSSDEQIMLPACDTVITTNPYREEAWAPGSKKPPTKAKSGSTIGRKDACMRRLSQERCVETAKCKVLLKRGGAKLVTHGDIENSRLEQDEKARLREMLERQTQLLQRIKDVEALKCWRKICTAKKSNRFLDNFQYSPSRNYMDKSPFDVDPDMFHMLNRADIYKSLKEWEDYHQRRAQAQNEKRNSSTNVWDLEQKISTIRGQLEALNLNDMPKATAETEDFHMAIVASRISQINKLRQVLLKLREENLKVM